MQSLSFFNILNGDLYLNALIIRLFQIYLGMGQTLREGTLQKVFFWCVEGEVGSCLAYRTRE